MTSVKKNIDNCIVPGTLHTADNVCHYMQLKMVELLDTNALSKSHDLKV